MSTYSGQIQEPKKGSVELSKIADFVLFLFKEVLIWSKDVWLIWMK